MTCSSSTNFSFAFSEAIHTISFSLLSLVRQRIFHPNVELECMILHPCDLGKLSNNIPVDKFKSILNQVIKTHNSRISHQTENKRFLPSEDTFYFQGRIRQSMIGFEKLVIQKDFLDREILFCPQVSQGFCVQVKTEKPLDKKTIQTLQKKLEEEKLKEEKIEEKEKSWNKETNQKGKQDIRTKQRFSIWWKKQPFRTDFTIVHLGSKEEQEIKEKKAPICQIETEFISDSKNLSYCDLTEIDFENEYNFSSPFISSKEIRRREKIIATELLEISLLILQPQQITTTLSLNLYPKELYIGSDGY